MVSLLLCLLDWCMAVPLSLLLDPITMPPLEEHAAQKAPLLDYIYRVGVLRVRRQPGLEPLCADLFSCSSLSFDISTPTQPRGPATFISLVSAMTL